MNESDVDYILQNCWDMLDLCGYINNTSEDADVRYWSRGIRTRVREIMDKFGAKGGD